MIKKILTITVILLLAVTIVAAADVGNMKMPADFKSTGTGMYNQQDSNGGGTGFNAAVYKYTDTDFQEWTTDDPTDNFKVTQNGDYYKYTSDADEGVVEVVEIDGEKFIVVFSATSLASGGVSDCVKFMEEFNSLNGAKPVSV